MEALQLCLMHGNWRAHHRSPTTHLLFLTDSGWIAGFERGNEHMDVINAGTESGHERCNIPITRGQRLDAVQEAHTLTNGQVLELAND